MKDNKSDKAGFKPVPVTKSGPRFVWAKALVVPVLIMAIIGSFAILSGRKRPRPIDWIHHESSLNRVSMHVLELFQPL